MKNIYNLSFEEYQGDDWQGVNCVCLDNEKKICIVLANDNPLWTLVGGGREEGETTMETLVREIKEEAQADPVEIKYLLTTSGWVENENGEIDEEESKKLKPQNRYICKLENINEFIPEKDGFEIMERKFVTVDELPNYLTWMNTSENGKEFHKLLKKIINDK